MPVTAGIAFGAVFLIWLVAMRGHKTETLKSDAASLDG
jgi:hypothetical protein